MKKSILSLCSLLLVINVLPAQTTMEALSLSTSNYHLSARQTAMGGASGALLSEMGAIAVNPAILGTYQTSELSFAPLYYNAHSSSDYKGTVHPASRFGFVLGHAGVVYSIQPRGTGNRYNVSFTYNRTNNFNVNNLAGNSSQPVGESFWQEMANRMNGLQQLGNNEEWKKAPDPFGAAFFQWGNLETGNNTMFNEANKNYTPLVAGGNVAQKFNIDMTGNIGEYALSFGTNLSQVANIGASVVLRDAEMSIIRRIYEEDGANYLNHYDLVDNSKVAGLGIGGKIGITINAAKDLYFGVAFHSPVYYSMTRTANDLKIGYNGSPHNDYTPGLVQETSFTLLTPMQFVLSASYNVMERVLLSLDYEGTPYSMAKLSASEGDNLDNVNNEVGESSFVSAVRFGAEVPVWRGLSVRAGAGYKTAINDYNQSTIHAGGGAGYRFGEASVDIAYAYMSNKVDYTLYQLAGSPMIMNNTKGLHLVNLSLSYRF